MVFKWGARLGLVEGHNIFMGSKDVEKTRFQNVEILKHVIWGIRTHPTWKMHMPEIDGNGRHTRGTCKRNSKNPHSFRNIQNRNFVKFKNFFVGLSRGIGHRNLASSYLRYRTESSRSDLRITFKTGQIFNSKHCNNSAISVFLNLHSVDQEQRQMFAFPIQVQAIPP
jgi:hypothetical protein